MRSLLPDASQTTGIWFQTKSFPDRCLQRFTSGAKVDFTVRKSSEYRQVEFGRRQPIDVATVRTWLVSREDPILSRLVWGS
jgi:hypothetical protein